MSSPLQERCVAHALVPPSSPLWVRTGWMRVWQGNHPLNRAQTASAACVAVGLRRALVAPRPRRKARVTARHVFLACDTTAKLLGTLPAPSHPSLGKGGSQHGPCRQRTRVAIICLLSASLNPVAQAGCQPIVPAATPRLANRLRVFFLACPMPHARRELQTLKPPVSFLPACRPAPTAALQPFRTNYMLTRACAIQLLRVKFTGCIFGTSPPPQAPPIANPSGVPSDPAQAAQAAGNEARRAAA